MRLKSKKAAILASSAAEEKKANRITILDLSKLSSFCDCFVICSGNSEPHIKAVADNILKKLKENKTRLLHVEGYNEAKWILLDYGDVLIHIFGEPERKFYNLEGLWGDAKVIKENGRSGNLSDSCTRQLSV